MKYLLSKGVKIPNYCNIVSGAFKNSNLDNIKWLYENGYNIWDFYFLGETKSNNNLEIFKWLKYIGQLFF